MKKQILVAIAYSKKHKDVENLVPESSHVDIYLDL